MKKFGFGAITASVIAFVAGFHSGDSKAEWDSDKLYITSSGSGDPVLIIPGLASSPDAFWEAFNNAEIEGHTSYWITLGGFGGRPSPRSPEPFTAPAASELARFIREQELTDVALIGHSMGGVVSMLVAAEITGRIDRILIVDSVPFLAGLIQPDADLEQITDGRAQILERYTSMTDEQFNMALRQGLAIQATSEKAQSIVWDDIERSDRRAIAFAAAEIFTTDYRSVLPDIDAKVTVLVPHNKHSPGSESQLLGRYKELYSGLESVEFKVIKDSRHFIMLDQPKLFSQAVEEFLGDANE
ncbi:MAG: alpha/beta hydrolase [Pseudomonadota bacterium]